MFDVGTWRHRGSSGRIGSARAARALSPLRSAAEHPRGRTLSDAPTDDALAAKLVHGLQPTRVTIVAYDPDWPGRFEARATELRAILGDRARLIEHIGSTSVPGLAAKPIIDVVVGIDDPDEEAAFVPDLEVHGYQLRVREPEHRCFRAGDADDAANVHCYPPDHREVRKYLAFRDRLRTSSEDRARYEALKRQLAEREWADVNYYAEAKGPLINVILARSGWATGKQIP